MVLYALAGYVFLKVATFVYVHFLRPGKNLQKYGEWAVVTGATDGIGEAIAKELASKGLNIVLISRTESKLKASALTIETSYGVKTKIVPVDFSTYTVEDDKRVRDAVSGLDVGILVNNVGASYDFPVYYHELPTGKESFLLDLNVRSSNSMLDIFLPVMSERKRGAIIAIGSVAGNGPSPLLASYTASKAYIDGLYRTLHYEYAGKVDIQVQTPCLIATKLAKIRKSSITVPSATAYAKVACKAIGYDARISPYWAHALQIACLNALPESISTSLVGGMHKALRKRGLKKMAAKAAEAN